MARTSKASKRASSVDILDNKNDPRHYDLSKKPIVVERVSAAINYLVMHQGARAATMSVAEVISQMGRDAGLNGEKLGPRTVQTVHLGLSRLEANGLIQMLDSKLELFSLTDKFKALIQQLSDMYKDHLSLIQNLDSLSRSRVQCAFFRSKFRTRAFKKQATRRELERENKKIKLECEEHRKICPVSKSRAPSVISEATEIMEEATKAAVSDGDSMYVDDIPASEGSRPIVLLPHTPARSGTLNNVWAYPTPESALRQTSSVPSTSYLTPSRSTSAPAPAPAEEEVRTDEDEEMEVSLELQEPSDILFASDAPVGDFQSPLDSALTEQIERLEKIIQQYHIKEQARMKSRRRSRLFVRYRHTLERKRWWRALERSRREYEQLKKESEVRERQLNQRHYEELRGVQNGHQDELRELDRRHAEEKKKLEDANHELRQRGLQYADQMRRISQCYISTL